MEICEMFCASTTILVVWARLESPIRSLAALLLQSRSILGSRFTRHRSQSSSKMWRNEKHKRMWCNEPTKSRNSHDEAVETLTCWEPLRLKLRAFGVVKSNIVCKFIPPPLVTSRPTGVLSCAYWTWLLATCHVCSMKIFNFPSKSNVLLFGGKKGFSMPPRSVEVERD